ADHPEAEPITCLVYGISDGLPTLAGSAGFTPAGFRAPDGRIWFPNAKGLAVVNPAQVERNRLPPPLVIEEVSVAGHSLERLPPERRGEGAVRIPPGGQQIEIQFAALSFSAPEKVMFKWRLQGLEKNWSEPQSRRVATYSYLPPGKYVFQLMACNNNGVWNENAATLPLAVLPFFWETWWFKLAITMLGLLLFVARSFLSSEVD
ncbi:MAG: triple tyrosine motif-containing protein, partial [Verrucomicrobiota bacterium]